MLRAVSTSDWHLAGGLASVFPADATSRQLAEIDKIFKWCVDNDIAQLFMPGDISDKARMDEATLIALVMLLNKYKGLVTMHYILGNHDFAHVGRTSIDVLELFSTCGALENLKIYRQPTIVTIDGVEVGFLPFPHTKFEEEGRKPKLIFAHIEEAGATGDNGLPLRSSAHGCTRRKEDFVISGHLHTYQVLPNKRIIFNGNPFQKNFGEKGKKGFIEFKAGYKGKELVVKHRFINNRPDFTLVNKSITEDKDFDTLERNPNVLYKITLGEGVVAPKDLTKDFPNIVMLNGVTYKGRSITPQREKQSIDKMPKITPLTGLVDFLHEAELSKAEIKQAVAMVKEAIRLLI